MRPSGTRRPRVAVIGAGAAGITTCKALAEVGLEPECFEASTHAGGLWNYDEKAPGGGPSYRSLRTNTSKGVTAFSDFPFAEGVPNFPSRDEMARYLAAYADAFRVIRHMRFGHRVLEIVRAEDAWDLRVCDGVREHHERFDAVVVCTGVFRKRYLPDVTGLESFPGRVLHTMDYGTSLPFAGRHVLVVGLGSSAVDIATDLLPTAGAVTMSVRRGAWVAPRVVGGRPLDHRNTRLGQLLPAARRAARRRRLLLAEYGRRGTPTPAAVWSRAAVPFRPKSAPSVTHDDLLDLLAAGALTAVPGITRIEGRRVCLSNGTGLTPDAIVFCTGYTIDFPFLPWLRTPWTDADSGLYRLVFPPDFPGLAFIGVCRAQGPILPIVEMQARWLARVLVGEARLPPAEEMRREIARRWHSQAGRGDSPYRVALLPYLDEVGAEIGVRPRLWKHPGLARHLLGGPPVAAQYRLDGPHTWPGAAAVVKGA